MSEQKDTIREETENALREQLALLRRASEQVGSSADDQYRGLCNLTDALVKVVTCIHEVGRDE